MNSSVTKSVLSALIGIALIRGYLKVFMFQLYTNFPELRRPGVDKRKLEITVLHLLTMTAGLRWTSNKEMESSKNWVRYILERPYGTTARHCHEIIAADTPTY